MTELLKAKAKKYINTRKFSYKDRIYTIPELIDKYSITFLKALEEPKFNRRHSNRLSGEAYEKYANRPNVNNYYLIINSETYFNIPKMVFDYFQEDSYGK